jgi:hypothetical protein
VLLERKHDSLERIEAGISWLLLQRIARGAQRFAETL